MNQQVDINAIMAADTIMDIIAMPPFHFHKLKGDMEGLFAVVVKTRREIAVTVKIVKVVEVSAHYE